MAPTNQAAIAAAVRQQRLSAVETERLVKQEIDHHRGITKRGSPATRVEYVTAKAKVVLIFRRQTVEQADILAALVEARAKAAGSQPALNIIRPE